MYNYKLLISKRKLKIFNNSRREGKGGKDDWMNELINK